MAVKKKNGRETKVTAGDGNIHRRGDGLGTGPVGNGGRGENNTGVKPGKKPAGSGVRPSGNGAKPSQSANQGSGNDRGLLDDLTGLSGLSGNSGNSQQGSMADLLNALGGQQQNQQQSQQGGMADLLNALGSQQQNQQQQQQFNQQNQQSQPLNLQGGGSGAGLGGLSSLLGGGAGNGGSGHASSSSGNGGKKKFSLFRLILTVIVLILIISLLSKCLGCNDNSISSYPADPYDVIVQTQAPETQAPSTAAPSSEAYSLEQETISASDPTVPYYYSDDIQSILAALLSGNGAGSFTTETTAAEAYNTWNEENVNVNVLETEPQPVATAETIRSKYTQLKGNGRDQVTIMVYMCGTDLESKYGCATNDLQEMLSANFGDNVNLLVYTGGCRKWNNKVMSSQNNQIYQIKGKQLYRLEENAGNKPMVTASTLTEFIQYCSKNFPANRNMLIFWDHGGGSVTGYGYDEKYSSKGSMSLAGIDTALRDGGVKFDMIGFDACLMATAENALMLDEYADYMVASEESEPGIGWYYTNWLTSLGNNTSIPTTQLGKEIADSFVSVCASKARGQSATLSVVDLAEFAGTVPTALANFSNATTELIKNSNYQTVAKARASSREFAQSSRIDQVDLVDFARRLGTDEAKALNNAILSAVKYNTTSPDMTNCYGVSIFFPYASARTVDAAVRTYNQIGLNAEYSKCIQEFAAMECSGSGAFGGTSASGGSLLNLLGGGTNSSSAYTSSADISSVLGALLGGDFSGMTGLSSENTGFFTGRALTLDDTASYIFDHQFDAGYLNWVEDGDDYKIWLPEEQWDLVTDLALSVYYDDGEGYIDLGIDNVYRIGEDNSLMAPDQSTWLAINGQVVSYYYEDSYSDGENFAIHGYVPAYLNGDRVELQIVFDNEHPEGVIAGAMPVYDKEETEQIAKSITELQDGDTLDFVCDYYTYEGEYQDSYYLGDQMIVDGEPELSNIVIGDGHANMMYRFTDIFNQIYWSEALIN